MVPAFGQRGADAAVADPPLHRRVADAELFRGGADGHQGHGPSSLCWIDSACKSSQSVLFRAVHDCEYCGLEAPTDVPFCRSACDAAAAAMRLAQTSTNPFPTPIEATAGVISVNFVEFAVIPDAAGGEAPRMMHLVDEPGTRSACSSARCAARSTASATTARRCTEYLDINAPTWGVGVQFAGHRSAASRASRSIRSSASAARRGYGKFYTYTDTTNMTPTPDFTPRRRRRARTTRCCSSGPRRIRRRRPTTAARRASCFASRSRSRITTAARSRSTRSRAADSPDFGLLYVGFADGGSGGDPLNLAQNLALGVRQDPAHRSARHEQRERQVRHSRQSNPFVNDNKPETLGEIYAYGVRNPQRFSWDCEDRPHVRRRHRPEHRRGDQPGHGRRESRLEQVGRQLQVRQPPGRSRRTRAAKPA